MSFICGPHCDEHCKRCIITYNIGITLYKQKKNQSVVDFLEKTLNIPLYNFTMGLINYKGGYR